MKKIFLICILNAFTVKAQQVNPFYLGHSLINFDIPAMVDGLASSANKISNYNQQIINGAPLAYNYSNHATAQGMSFQSAFPSGGFNNFVITEAIPLQNHLSFIDTFGYANTFFNYAKNNNNGVPVNFYIYETWHCTTTGSTLGCSYDNDDALQWHARLQADFSKWTGIVSHVRNLNTSDASKILLVPAGQAMYNLTTKINANLLPDITSFTNLFYDDIHLTNKGNYFIACVMYATLFRESPVGLSANLNNQYGITFTNMPTAQQALVMQQTAWETVIALNSWTGVVSLNNKEFKSNFLKTYPNPVLNELIIDNFESNEISNYEIYNNLGKIVSFGKLEKATVSTINLSNGFYFLRVYHDDQFKIVKFIKN